MKRKQKQKPLRKTRHSRRHHRRVSKTSEQQQPAQLPPPPLPDRPWPIAAAFRVDAFVTRKLAQADLSTIHEIVLTNLNTGEPLTVRCATEKPVARHLGEIIVLESRS